MTQYTALHLFAGLGGGALGFERAGFRNVGAVDVSAEACQDHDYLCDGEATQADLATLLPSELADIAGERPDVVFTSPPCKSFSGCLPAATAETDEYQELSSLAQRGIWIALEAWSDSPPPLIVMENVPRIQSRGAEWLEECVGMLRAYGYAVSETTHDCGRLGRLAQKRRRYLLVARHVEQVPEYLYEPPKYEHRAIGEVLEELPVPIPDFPDGGPMHRLPRLSAKNWLRLACIPAGGDFRDLPESVAVCDGYRGRYGVLSGDQPSPTVRGAHEPRLAPASWADPRVNCTPRATVYGVTDWADRAGTVVGHARHDNGSWSLADPRVDCDRREGSLGVQAWSGTSTSVIGHATIHNWPLGAADPRLDYTPRQDSYGVCGWRDVAKTVRGVSKYANGATSVAEPRLAEPTHILGEHGGTPVLSGPPLQLDSRRSADPVPVILARDGTWHRPMTTLELAALQGFPTKVGGEWLELAGGSKARWRERIGNAVPPPAAEAIARTCQETLEAAEDEGFFMSGQPVWVEQPREVAQ